MILILVIAILGIAGVSTQASYSSDSFTYWGCGSVDPTRFGEPITFPPGQLTPEVCKATCAGHMFAAVSPESVSQLTNFCYLLTSFSACRCGDDSGAIASLDETKCDNPCTQDPDSPMCGGLCPDERPDVSNVFVTNPVSSSIQEPVTSSSVLSDPPPPPPANPPPSVIEATETASQDPPIVPPQAPPPTATPEVPVPPASAVPPSSSEQTSSGIPVVSEPGSPTLSSQSSSITSLALPPTGITSSPLTDPITVPSSSSVPPASPTLVPGQPWQVPEVPSDTLVPSVTGPTVPGETIITGSPSDVTLWPEPSTIQTAEGDPLMPSQLTISDSAQVGPRFLTAFGVLVLMAVMAV